MSSSRERILNAVKANQPEQRELPALPIVESGLDAAGLAAKFTNMLETIGGKPYIVSGYARIASILHEQFPDAIRIVTNIPEVVQAGASVIEYATGYDDAHTLENVDLAVIRAHFGVAENAACWVTEDLMVERALPFIAQNLALVIRLKDVVPHMHAAYERIAAIEAAAGGSYGFAAFIAGPSKTADIEQSLVLGAHGPRSMTVFVLDEEMSDAGFF